MDGRVERPPPTPRAPLRRSLVEISTLIRLVSSTLSLWLAERRGREAGEAQCVFNNGTNMGEEEEESWKRSR